MILKTYAYPGITSGEIQIKVGRALIRVPFVNGYLDRKMSRPATYSTYDPVMQSIIESSDLFGRRIFLKDITGTPEENKAEQKPAKVAETPALPEEQSFPDVTTYEEVLAVLKANGAKAVQLRSQVSAKRFAETKNIKFPNFSFE